MATLLVTGRRDGKPDRVFITRRVPSGRSDAIRVRVIMQDDKERELSFDVEAYAEGDRVHGSCVVRDECGSLRGMQTLDGGLYADTAEVRP